jgi:hypothetical protein
MSDNLENTIPEKKKEVILTEPQQLIVLEMLNENPNQPPKIKDILIKVFGRQIDAREMEGLAVRKFIAEKGLSYTGARTNVPVKIINLTEEHKQFIVNNISTMKPLEMARVLFDNKDLTMTDTETREIYKYIKDLPKNISNQSLQRESINLSNYKPPKTESEAINRINKFVHNINIVKEELTEKQKRDIKNLIGYLHTIRYLDQVNTYGLDEERQLFESEFVRCTYDKDLTEEEVSQYIIYCTDTIIARQINKRIQDLEREQDRQIEENNGRPNMALVDQISSLRTEYNQCINRQKTSIKSLQGERKERMKIDSQNKGNIADLISYALSEDKRKHLLNIAEERRNKIKDEINRIKSLDDIIVEVFGVDPHEIMD